MNRTGNLSLQQIASVGYRCAELWRNHIAAAKLPDGPIGDTSLDAVLLMSLLEADVKSRNGKSIPAVDTMDDKERQESAEELLALARWSECGYPTFQITESLASSLILTDPSALRIEDIKWPYNSFVISMPWPRSPLAFNGVRGVTGIRWICCHNFKRPKNQATVSTLNALMNAAGSLYQNSKFDEASVKLTEDRIRSLMPSNVNDFGFVGSCRVVGQSDMDNIFHLGQSVDVSESVSDWMAYINSGKLGQRDEACIVAMLSLVANFCAFLRGGGAGSGIARKSGARRDKDGTIHPPVWVVGQAIKLSRELRDAAADFASGKRREREWHLKRRFVVRGHWRNQAVGLGRSERRPMWIAPHWKGPADAAASLVRLYEADSKPSENNKG